MKRFLRNFFLIAGTALFCFNVCADNFQTACLEDFSEYDKLMLKRSQGPLSQQDSTAMMQHLVSALNNFKEHKASQGENIPDDLAKAIGKHYNDFTVAGIFMFQNEDYKGAYSIWEACVDLPDNPSILSAITNIQNDRGQIAFNRAIAATQAGMKTEALASYDKAYTLGYNDNQLFDSAIMMAEQARDYVSASKWAQRGVERMGQTSIYRDYLIKYASLSDLNKAVELCTETIAIDPNNPKWYNRRIEANEKLKNHEAVLEDMKKVTELSPSDPVAMYNYGAKKMYITNIAKNEKSASKEELKAMYAEATASLEKACEVANGDQRTMPAVVKSLNMLDQYYHDHGDKAGKKRVEEYRVKFGITKKK